MTSSPLRAADPSTKFRSPKMLVYVPTAPIAERLAVLRALVNAGKVTK